MKGKNNKFRWMLLIGILISVWITLPAQDNKLIKLEIEASEEIKNIPSNGRMIIIFGEKRSREPRRAVGWPGKIPFFGIDIDGWNSAEPLIITDNKSLIGYYRDKMNSLDPGEYNFQVLFDVDTTFSYINAHGNYYSDAILVNVKDNGPTLIKATLKHQIIEKMPESSEYAKYVRIQSDLLTRFWGKPMYLRAGVLLPSGFYENPDKKYPVRYNIGGYHARYTRLARKTREGSDFMKWWLSGEAPQMIVVFLDGEAPYGDSYQMNSQNNGPYADATMKELIPFVEKEYRGVGKPEGRFLDGGSTGGWVVLALQILYPDFFNGAWSTCADPVDFQFFQLVNIYKDENAYVNNYGNERPAMRTTTGEPVFSMRQEVQTENVLGRKNSYLFSGGQWGGWNAVYSPRDPSGTPTAIWEPHTGKINPEIAEEWVKWDLRKYLEQNWTEVGPKIQGKIKIWMGDMDSFFLNNAMRLLEKFFAETTNPRSDVYFSFGPGKGHCGHRISEREIMKEMMNKYSESIYPK